MQRPLTARILRLRPKFPDQVFLFTFPSISTSSLCCAFTCMNKFCCCCCCCCLSFMSTHFVLCQIRVIIHSYMIRQQNRAQNTTTQNRQQTTDNRKQATANSAQVLNYTLPRSVGLWGVASASSPTLPPLLPCRNALMDSRRRCCCLLADDRRGGIAKWKLMNEIWYTVSYPTLAGDATAADADADARATSRISI